MEKKEQQQQRQRQQQNSEKETKTPLTLNNDVKADVFTRGRGGGGTLCHVGRAFRVRIAGDWGSSRAGGRGASRAGSLGRPGVTDTGTCDTME